MTKIAIITTDYNHHQDTAEWLESKNKLETDKLNVLWLVIDNGSDTSVREIVKNYPEVVWIQNGKNLGFAGGFNRGLRYAREWGAEYFLIMNNDTLFGDGEILHNLIQVLRDNPKAGLVSPKIFFAPSFEFFKEKYTKKDEGKVIWYAGGTFDYSNIRSVHRGIDEVDRGKYDVTEKTGFVSGCCLLIKREVLEKIGYFNEKLFAYYEDADFVERVKANGFEQWYCGESFIYHKVSRTTGIGSDWTDYLITRNRLWFGLKYSALRTKYSLLKESVRLLLTGRMAQKQGILDYLKGIWGGKNQPKQANVEYPLTLSIIAINYMTTSLMMNLLKSIFNDKSGFNNVSGGAEVVILDNSPEEPCRNEVLKVYPRIKFISNNTNNGFSAANNQMIDYSLGKHVLLLNSDIEVKPGAFTKLMAEVDKHGDENIYSAKLLFPSGKVQDSCYRLPTAIGAFNQYFLNKPGSYFMFSPAGNNPVKVEGAVMACFLIPRKIINKIGNLSEDTFIYFDDIEYCRRAKRANVPLYFIPQAEFIHFHGQASKMAGLETSTRLLIKASKWYHGLPGYYLLTAVLWAGQKFGKVATPQARWKKE
jgi:GT2 family glycosyltransferase